VHNIPLQLHWTTVNEDFQNLIKMYNVLIINLRGKTLKIAWTATAQPRAVAFFVVYFSDFGSDF